LALNRSAALALLLTVVKTLQHHNFKTK